MKQYYQMTLLEKILISISWKLEKYVYKRNWTTQEHLDHIRIHLQQDSDWLHHNKLAKEIIDRHVMLSDSTWIDTPVESIDKFRTSIGLDYQRNTQ